MSIVSLTNFTQTNGYIPATALTAISKDDDKINVSASTEDVDETVSRVRDLLTLRDTIVAEGMSRKSAARFMEIAPEAIPTGFGLEMFTELPTRVHMSHGTESILSTAITQLGKLIMFLIDKLKKAGIWLLDAYQALTGIKPTSYRVLQRMQYREEMEKCLERSLGGTVNEAIRKSLAEGMFDAPSAVTILEGAFVDSSRICQSLIRFNTPIANLQRAVEAATAEAVSNAEQVNKIINDPHGNAAQITQKITQIMTQDKAYTKMTNLIRVIATGLRESNLYKAPGKDKKAILDDLSSSSLGDILEGLTACINKTETFTPDTELAIDETQISDSDLKAILENLSQLDPASVKDIRKLKEAVSHMKSFDSKRVDAVDMWDAYSRFLSKNTEIVAAIEVARGLTANYAGTVIKIAGVRDNIKHTQIVRMVINNPEEYMLNAGNNTVELIQKYFASYMRNISR